MHELFHRCLCSWNPRVMSSATRVINAVARVLLMAQPVARKALASIPLVPLCSFLPSFFSHLFFVLVQPNSLSFRHHPLLSGFGLSFSVSSWIYRTLSTYHTSKSVRLITCACQQHSCRRCPSGSLMCLPMSPKSRTDLSEQKFFFPSHVFTHFLIILLLFT